MESAREERKEEGVTGTKEDMGEEVERCREKELKGE